MFELYLTAKVIESCLTGKVVVDLKASDVPVGELVEEEADLADARLGVDHCTRTDPPV